MHMYMWFGYDLGDLLFEGLKVNTRLSFAITWLLLFFTALLFEASKVYLAKVQRDAIRKLYPYRPDERRNLLSDRENVMEPSTSRNLESPTPSRWSMIRLRAVISLRQAVVFVSHHLAGYLLMLCVMLYNVHLLLACVFGMMLGYFLFGTKLTELQMQCFNKKKVICTPECDHTAATSTPPLLDSSGSETDLFICRTETCIQPSHYFDASSTDTPTCSYGAKRCPSMVARAQITCNESEKEGSPSVEDVQLLKTQGCCKKPSPEQCCKDVVPKTCNTELESSGDGDNESKEMKQCCKEAKKEILTSFSNEVVSEEHELEKSCKEIGAKKLCSENEEAVIEQERHTIGCCASKTDSLEEIVK